MHKFHLVHICGIREFVSEVDVENVIQAPPYPETHGNTMDCWYTIKAPSNTRIRFWVDDFGTVSFHPSQFYMWVSDNTQTFIVLS